MARFNFTNITLSSRADITKVMDNFNLIETNGALLSDVQAVSQVVSNHTNQIAINTANITNNTTAISDKAPTSHASSNTTYGVGTTSNYGHCKIINALTSSSYNNGEVLAAYQGYLLSTQINTKQKKINYGTAVPTGGSNGDIYLQYFN